MATNIPKLRKAKEWSQYDLARISGLSQTAIAQIELGNRTLNKFNREKLAKALGVSEEELTEESKELTNNDNNNIVYLPLCEYRLSAGKGILQINNSINKEDYSMIPVKKELLEKLTLTNHANLQLLPISGDSMEPTLKDNDLAILDKSVNELSEHGGIYAFDYNGESYLKRVQKTPDKLVIISDNAKYPTWTIKIPPEHEFKILGKVKVSFALNKI
ncbi:MAG: LexA family transcriptional regulator [Alphaproteobacteria bacterium]|nr:LexA family transcriptional regulator [Alphaproteobacteria bacterium]